MPRNLNGKGKTMKPINFLTTWTHFHGYNVHKTHADGSEGRNIFQLRGPHFILCLRLFYKPRSVCSDWKCLETGVQVQNRSRWMGTILEDEKWEFNTKMGFSQSLIWTQIKLAPRVSGAIASTCWRGPGAAIPAQVFRPQLSSFSTILVPTLTRILTIKTLMHCLK